MRVAMAMICEEDLLCCVQKFQMTLYYLSTNSYCGIERTEDGLELTEKLTIFSPLVTTNSQTSNSERKKVLKINVDLIPIYVY